jgi:hypothetical protein
LQPLTFALYHFDLGGSAAIAQGLGLSKILGQQLHIQANRRERILDLVRQPPGQHRDLGVLRDELFVYFLGRGGMREIHAEFRSSVLGSEVQSTESYPGL